MTYDSALRDALKLARKRQSPVFVWWLGTREGYAIGVWNDLSPQMTATAVVLPNAAVYTRRIASH